MDKHPITPETLKRLAKMRSPHHGFFERLYDFTGLNRWFLRSGSPPQAHAGPEYLVSPADCKVDVICPIAADGDVPGKAVLGGARRYALADLVGPGFDKELDGGWCMMLYLAPTFLHWMVSPLSGKLVEKRYRAGRCWPIVVFKRGEVENERLGLVIDQGEGAKIQVVFVGSFMVSGIVCSHEVGEEIEQGGLLGGFKLGSTVLLLVPPNIAEPIVQPGQRLFPGQPLAKRID